MTESMPETSSQPGLILKTAREEMSLSIEQVAQELHLRPAVVKALEEENYSEFNSDVFLKGYFRTYCRLVKLHEDRMVEILDKQLNLIKDKTESALELETKALLSRKRRKTFVTFFIFLVCAGLIAFTYYMSTNSAVSPTESSAAKDSALMEGSSEERTSDYSTSDYSTSPEGVTTEKTSASTTFTDASLAENNAQEEQNVEANLAPSQESEIIVTEEFEEPVNTESASITEADTETSDPVIPDNTENTSSANEASSIENNSSQSSETATVLSSIYAVFSGDCWFKVTDGTGKTVIADLKTANDEVNYQGIAPFHIVIGDASKVSLQFEGESIDLAAYSSRNGRAELNLKPKYVVTGG